MYLIIRISYKIKSDKNVKRWEHLIAPKAAEGNNLGRQGVESVVIWVCVSFPFIIYWYLT